MSRVYGERIRLRAVEREDVKFFVEWLNDPEVTFGLSMYLPMSLADEEKWFEGLAHRTPPEKPLAIEMREGEGWKLIGNSGFFDMDSVARSAEVGILIGEKSVWNQGFGTETMRLLLQHGFETLNLNRVFLRVYVENPRAVRAYEKAGSSWRGRCAKRLSKKASFWMFT
jgi:RimJ/RimL family protein N-acetyltransferase